MPTFLLNYWLATPTVAPTRSDSSSGSFVVTHRRVNPDGTYTAPSPLLTSVILPNTFTPQSYATADVTRDEFLISNDSGTTWKIIPRSGTLTGAQTVTAFDSSWTTTTLTDTQTSEATAVDFGTFLAGDSSTKVLWIYNNSLAISSLSFDVLTALGASSDLLNNILEISITGTVIGDGNGTLNTSFNATKVFDRRVSGSNLFTVTSGLDSAIRLELQLINYPLTGLSENIDLQLDITPNNTVPIPATRNPVAAGRLLHTVDNSGVANGTYLKYDSDGVYVYASGDTSVLTIGNASSGALVATNFMDKLFTLIWDRFPTSPIYTNTGVLTTRGASAAADYAANKGLSIAVFRDAVLGVSSASSGSGTTLGSNSLTLVTNNLPAHSHTFTTDAGGGNTPTMQSAGDHNHTPIGGGTGFVVNGAAYQVNVNAGTGAANSATTNTAGAHTHTMNAIPNHTHTGTTANTGLGTAINNRQLTVITDLLISTGY